MKFLNSYRKIPKIILLVIPFKYSPLLAQTPPDSGLMFRQQESSKPQLKRLPPPEPQDQQPLSKSGEEVTVLVKDITIKGAESLESNEVLQELVKDAIGQKLGFKQLEEVAGRISRHLKTKGWLLAKAYLPKQDVTEGRILIEVTVGHIEKDVAGQSIQIERLPDTRLRRSVILRHLRTVISGEQLQADDLERGLLLLNDLPGVSAKATLEKGLTPGGSQLGVQVQESDILNGSFAIDDFGNRYTGPWRGTLNLNLNDAFGLGEQLSLSGSGAENLGQGSISYSQPIGGSGLRGNIHYSYLDYSLGREFESLKSQGTSHYGGAGLSYPFMRSRAFSLWGTADYTHKSLDDRSLQVLTSRRQVDNGTMGFNGQLLDEFNGGGLTMFSYAATLGYTDLTDVPADFNSDQSYARTQGLYDKHNFNLSRLQKISDAFSLYVAGTGQLASKNLVSAEKFLLGGPNGVRAYPVGEGVGDSGWITNVELHYDLPTTKWLGNVQLIGFFDVGYVTQHEQRYLNDVTNKTRQNGYLLSGSGISANITLNNRFVVRGTWAHTIGDNPGRSNFDKDSDGKSDDNRFWLQGVAYF